MESMPIKDNTKPLSIFQINGAKDSTIPIDGGIAFPIYLMHSKLQSCGQ